MPRKRCQDPFPRRLRRAPEPGRPPDTPPCSQPARRSAGGWCARSTASPVGCAVALRKQRKLVPYAPAVARRLAIDWSTSPPGRPAFLGTRTLRDFPLAEIVSYIDWSPFFMAWELRGKYPAILSDRDVGKEASKL